MIGTFATVSVPQRARRILATSLALGGALVLGGTATGAHAASAPTAPGKASSTVISASPTVIGWDPAVISASPTVIGWDPAVISASPTVIGWDPAGPQTTSAA